MKSHFYDEFKLVLTSISVLVFVLCIAVASPADSAEPVLIVSSSSNPFSGYYAEILRAEGFSEFDVKDLPSLSPSVLSSYDIVILGEMPLTTSQVTMLSDWVNGGGRLIAMRPDKKLAGLLGLTDLSSTLSNAYLLVNTSSGPGVGIVNQTIQYHGTADRYSLSGASTVATLYSSTTTATSSPAVTLNSVGANGGQAAAFTYDLARSVVYTRQGNPAWAGQDRDGQPPVRSDDLFYGPASFDPQPNWINLNKVAIPQADEQQRLLANLMIQMNFNKKPLPRFWYFPRNLPAVVVMTGDDHGGSRLKFISQFVSEIRTEVQFRRQRISIHRPACAGYAHPSSLFVFRCESAGFSGGAFEHCENVVAELITPFDLNRRPSDRITIAIDIHCTIG